MDGKLLWVLLFGIGTIVGCADGTQGLNSGSRNLLASEVAMSEARQSAEICARHAPDGSKVIASLNTAGFTKSPDFDQIIAASPPPPSGEKSLGLLEKANHGLVVYVFSHIPDDSDRGFLDTFLCSIAVKNMSLEQAHELAKTWIDKFQATEDTLFRGTHAQNQVLGLQAVTSTSQVQIRILRTTSHIEGRGAAISLEYQERNAAEIGR